MTRITTFLGTGALSVGVGAAVLSGAAAAHADTSDGATDRGHAATARTATAPSQGPRAAASRRSERNPAASVPVRAAAVAPAAARAAEPTRTAETAAPVVNAPVANQSAAPAASSKAKAQPGPVITFLVSDGTATHPNAGLLFGNGFSYTEISCSAALSCAGGNGGLIAGNGGSGYNGGNGGNGGFFGNGGTGGGGTAAVNKGGNGGNGGFFGNGGSGGSAFFLAINAAGGSGGRGGLIMGNGGNGGNASSFANGGDGGRGGFLFGNGGRGGAAGAGSVACAVNTCTVTSLGGSAGQGGRGGFLGQTGKNGFGILPLNAPQYNGYTAVYPVLAPDTAAKPGQDEIGPNGATINGNYPNPYAVAGTIVKNAQLPAGYALARWGASTGSFLTPDGTKFSQVVLAPFSQVLPYAQYVVKDPAKLPPAVTIEQSVVAPWYDQPGGGIQYRFLFAGTTNDVPVEYLIDAGYLAYNN